MKKQLLAPNGKPSNLTPEQYKLVRTPAFKKWFGDWENDLENSSKVVDENGEPLVVYHGTDKEFNVFELKGLSNGFFFTKNIEDEEFSQKGWLKSQGLTYEQAIEKGYDLIYEKVKPYFLKIKQFYKKENVKNSSWSTPYFENVVIEFAKRNKKNDGVEFLREIDNKQIIVAFEPNQIKLADGTNTTFDENNDDIRFKDGGNVLLAPNGKPSNLTPEQYKLVRTPAFKKWFGDWENDPENASKVVDENGEPLVVYHGTASDFNIFKIGRTGGLFLTNNKNSAERFSSGDLKRTGSNPKTLNCFINIKKYYDKNTNDEILVDNYYQDYFENRPFIKKQSQKNILKNKFNKYFWDLVSFGIVNEEPLNFLIKKGYDGIIIDSDNNSNSYIVFESNQIKLADGSNTTFDSGNSDIRFDEGGEVNTGLFGETDKIKNLFLENGFTEDDLQIILEENENYFNQIEFYDNETLIVYRALELPRKLADKFIKLNKKEIGDGIGEYWTFDKNLQNAIWGDGHYEEETYLIQCKGHLKIKDIDWEMMKYAYDDDIYHFSQESEIRGVNGGNSIKVVECEEIIYSNGGEVNTGLFAQIWGWFGIKF